MFKLNFHTFVNIRYLRDLKVMSTNQSVESKRQHF